MGVCGDGEQQREECEGAGTVDDETALDPETEMEMGMEPAPWMPSAPLGLVGLLHLYSHTEPVAYLTGSKF